MRDLTEFPRSDDTAAPDAEAAKIDESTVANLANFIVVCLSEYMFRFEIPEIGRHCPPPLGFDCPASAASTPDSIAGRCFVRLSPVVGAGGALVSNTLSKRGATPVTCDEVWGAGPRGSK